MTKNVIVATICLAAGVPLLVGSIMQERQLFDLIDETGANGSVATFTMVVQLASLLAVAVGVVCGLAELTEARARSLRRRSR